MVSQHCSRWRGIELPIICRGVKDRGIPGHVILLCISPIHCCICMYLGRCRCMYMYVDMYMHECVNIHTYTLHRHTCSFTNAYIFTYKCIYIYIHIYIYIWKPVQALNDKMVLTQVQFKISEVWLSPSSLSRNDLVWIQSNSRQK